MIETVVAGVMGNMKSRANHELAPIIARMIEEVIETAREMIKIILGVVDDGAEALYAKTRMHFRFEPRGEHVEVLINMNLDAEHLSIWLRSSELIAHVVRIR